MDCECSSPDGSDSGLECTYPKCAFGVWEDKQQPDYKRPDAAPPNEVPLCKTCGQNWDSDTAAERCTYPECPYGDTHSDAAPRGQLPNLDSFIPETRELTMDGRGPKIICLCGSSRFVAEMAVIAWNLETEGAITMGLHLLPGWYTGNADHQAEHEGIAEKMDALHLRKIDLADEVFVVNVGGYYGDSTAREIQYARDHGKPVRFLEDKITRDPPPEVEDAPGGPSEPEHRCGVRGFAESGDECPGCKYASDRVDRLKGDPK